jgi:hypothetical protein
VSDTSVVAWTGRVFDAVYEATKPAGSTVGLGPIAERLGLAAAEITTEELTAETGPGRALMNAMGELDDLGLVGFPNVAYGIAIESGGRDLHDKGFDSLRRDFFQVHVSDRALAFLHALVSKSEERHDGWAIGRSVWAHDVFAHLGSDGTSHAGMLEVYALVDDLAAKAMVTIEDRDAFGKVRLRPSFGGFVRTTTTDPDADGVKAGLLDWSARLPGWESIEDALAEVKLKLDAARSDDDFEDIGRRVRETATDAVMLVATGDMVPPGKAAPGSRDAEAWLAVYLSARLGGPSGKEMRDALKANLALANAVQHGSRHRVPGAVMAAQGLIALVRSLQAIERATAEATE